MEDEESIRLDPALAEVVRRRIEDVKAGRVELIPHDVVQAHVLKRLEERREDRDEEPPEA